MKFYHKNPRQITGKQYGDLEKWLLEFGDLSGIVHDLNSDEIISGNQRGRVFDIDECEIVKAQEFDEPDAQAPRIVLRAMGRARTLPDISTRHDDSERRVAGDEIRVVD